ncbi:MAG: deoxyhypusine synthase [Bacteroidetes bacterium]|nr:deoxyhypusine synthase [Bacteroidota bacterium]
MDKELLTTEIEHFNIKTFNAVDMVDQFSKMAIQSRNLAVAAKIYEEMLLDTNNTVILTLAGSLFSAGLKQVVIDMMENTMVDVIVSTGANIVDQDFFEGLGFKHYRGDAKADDDELFKKGIDRIYDTYISEDELRVCDETIKKIAAYLEPRPYSSREFIYEMGRHLSDQNPATKSVVQTAFEKDIPIFVPAFSDCSAGFGLVAHQWERKDLPKVSIDSVKDFLELTQIKINSNDTGLFMIGGGVPKNFAQDIVVSAELLGEEVKLHKYAIQVTVADERDGALSGSTLKEAHSWGKVSEENEAMVFCEATVGVPIIASYAYHKGAWKDRSERRLNKLFEKKETISS